MMRIAAFALIALFLCAIRHAQAEPSLWVSPGGQSIHAEAGHNGHNGGLLLEYAPTETWSVMGGVLRNSQSSHSRLIAATYTPWSTALPFGLTAKAGVLSGLIDGYRLRDGHPVPMAALHLDVGTERVRFTASLFPAVKDASAGAVLFSVKVRLP